MARLYNGVILVDRPSPENIRRIDMGAMPLIDSMHRWGFQLDIPHLQRLSSKLSYLMQRKEWELADHLPPNTTINITSPKWVADLLFHKLRVQGNQKVYLTSSESWEATGSEVLQRFQNNHPAVGIILDHREYHKLKSTYADALPRLVDSNSRIHTRLKLGPVTGRYASESPNLQNQPRRSALGREIRKAFMADTGWMLVELDLCLAGDTPIITTEGHRPIRDIKVGDGVLALQLSTKKLIFRRVTRTAKLPPKQLLKITTLDGSSVLCTPEHKWLRKKYGTPDEWVETKDLKAGDSLIHVYETEVIRTGSGAYMHWWVYSNRNYISQHRSISEFINGPTPPGFEVDHIDGNPSNNVASNLRLLPQKINRGHGAQRWWNRASENQRKAKNASLVKGIKENRRSYIGDGNPRYGKRSGVEITCLYCGTKKYVFPSRSEYKFCGRQCYAAYRASNHKIVSIEPVSPEPVYQIEVEHDHNYVLANGMVSKNSQIEMRMVAHLSGEQSMIDGYHDPKWDMHVQTAVDCFPHISEDTIRTPDGKLLYRLPCKNVGFGVVYRIAADGLQATIVESYATAGIYEIEGLKVPDYWTTEKCDRLIKTFYRKRPAIAKWQNEQDRRAMRYKMVWTPFGRWRLIPQTKSALEWVKSKGLREGGNHPVQGGSQDYLKLAMAEIYDRLLIFNGSKDLVRALLTVHDSLIFECRGEQVAQDWIGIAKPIMEGAARLDVPVLSSSEIGERWGEMD